MAKKSSRRRHPGVGILKPQPASRLGWRLQYRDPDSKKTVREALGERGRTDKMREARAVAKSAEIQKRLLELEAGATRARGVTVEDAIALYFAEQPTLSVRSRLDYGAAAKKFVAFAKQRRLVSLDHLTRPLLFSFAAEIRGETKRRVTVGGKRGAHSPTAEARSAETINGELRKVRTVLEYLRKVELLPRITGDHLRDAFERVRPPVKRVQFLSRLACQQLLWAALRHDEASFRETRDEHRGKGQRGTTRRYQPVAPYVALVLLTGGRKSEALGIEWQHVDLDARDYQGRAVGEIHLFHEVAKGERARTVGLDISPMLRTMLAAMHLRSGGRGSVFGELTEHIVASAMRRMRDEFGAPRAFTWQALRRTCDTFGTNAPGIFGAASAYQSSRRIRHSVTVAQKDYLGLVRDIPPDVRSLEAAMQIEESMRAIIAQVSASAQSIVSRAQ
jgi:integrase